MTGLELPGGIRVEEPNPIAAQIIQGLAPLLVGISNQLDLLIKIECAVVTRAEVRESIQEHEAKLAAKANGQGKDAR